MFLVSYLFLLWLLLFGSVVPKPWLDLEGNFFGSFSVSVYCGSIWREVFLVPLQTAAIAAASGGKLLWFLFSQHLLWLHLAGDKFLVPFKSVLAGSCFGSFSVSIYCGRIWREISFWFLLSQHLLCPHLAGSFVLVTF